MLKKHILQRRASRKMQSGERGKEVDCILAACTVHALGGLFQCLYEHLRSLLLSNQHKVFNFLVLAKKTFNDASESA